MLKIPKHFKRENIRQEQIFPRPAMISPGAGVQSVSAFLSAEKLTAALYTYWNALFYFWHAQGWPIVWMTRRLSKQIGKTKPNCMFLLCWNRVTLMLTQLTCVLILCKYVHVILSPYHSSSIHPHAMPFFPLLYITSSWCMYAIFFISVTNLEASIHRVS